MDKKITWRAKELGVGQKSRNWYWAVGIISGGGAIAGLVVGNVLLALLILLGGFAVMVAGSRPPAERAYAVSNTGVHVGAHIIPWDKIRSFAVRETHGSEIVLETETLWGTVALPMVGVDQAAIIMELKNRNVEESDSLDTFVESITRSLGL